MGNIKTYLAAVAAVLALLSIYSCDKEEPMVDEFYAIDIRVSGIEFHNPNDEFFHKANVPVAGVSFEVEGMGKEAETECDGSPVRLP